MTYAEAARRVAKMRAEEQSRLNPDCVVKFMTHDRSVERAIVFAHGYMNCPQQFEKLGKKFHDLGYNVLIAPLPHHGLPGQMSTDHSRLKAEQLASYGDEVLDIGRGLGRHVTMAGLSCGGVVAAWVAQNRPDIDLAVLISPAFGFKQVPTRLSALTMYVFRILPNQYRWRDPLLRANIGPSYGYPRYSSHALMQIMRLGLSVKGDARRNPPAARQVLVITNPNDDSVNNELTRRVVDLWRQHSASVTAYEFPASMNLPHDLIDPSQPHLDMESVYPILVDLITK